MTHTSRSIYGDVSPLQRDRDVQQATVPFEQYDRMRKAFSIVTLILTAVVLTFWGAALYKAFATGQW